MGDQTLVNGAVAEPVAAANTGAAWASIDIPKGTRYAHVRLKTADAFIVPTADATDPTEDGCSYPVNCPIRLDLGGVSNGQGKLHHKQDGAAGTIHVTFFGA